MAVATSYRFALKHEAYLGEQRRDLVASIGPLIDIQRFLEVGLRPVGWDHTATLQFLLARLRGEQEFWTTFGLRRREPTTSRRARARQLEAIIARHDSALRAAARPQASLQRILEKEWIANDLPDTLLVRMHSLGAVAATRQNVFGSSIV